MRIRSEDEALKICIINTGGTISCLGDPLAPMSAEDFATASRDLLVPAVRRAFPHTEIVFAPALNFPVSPGHALDSANLQPADWCRMARCILERYDDFDGFVLLHGTDTMGFTGSGLPFLLNAFDAQGFGTAVLSKPVIVTGAQVPMYAQTPNGLELRFNTDAYRNFCGALACARLGIPEVAVFFDSRLYRGNRVLKVDAGGFRAFASPNCPVLADCGVDLDLHAEHILPGPVSRAVSLDDPDARSLALAQLAAVETGIDACPAAPFAAFPAAPALIAGMIEAVVARGVKGLVLESYGEGNFPSGDPVDPAAGAVRRALCAADAAGVTILNCTQVFAGTVDASAYAAGAWLPGVGAIGAADMTPAAGLAKMTVLLAAAAHRGWSRETVKRLLQLDLAGEMRPVSRLDSRRGGALLPGQSIRTPDGSAQLINSPKRGLQLIAADGTVLWTPYSAGPGRSGRLVMQNDGDLVFYDDNNAALWATGTGVPAGAASVLDLSGSCADGTLELSVWDYSRGRRVACIWPRRPGRVGGQDATSGM